LRGVRGEDHTLPPQIAAAATAARFLALGPIQWTTPSSHPSYYAFATSDDRKTCDLGGEEDVENACMYIAKWRNNPESHCRRPSRVSTPAHPSHLKLKCIIYDALLSHGRGGGHHRRTSTQQTDTFVTVVSDGSTTSVHVTCMERMCKCTR
jgi:hypothetical protein